MTPNTYRCPKDGTRLQGFFPPRCPVCGGVMVGQYQHSPQPTQPTTKPPDPKPKKPRKCKPRRFTKAVQRRFLELVAQGYSETKAAKVVGINPCTVSRHKQSKGLGWRVESARVERSTRYWVSRTEV